MSLNLLTTASHAEDISLGFPNASSLDGFTTDWPINVSQEPASPDDDYIIWLPKLCGNESLDDAFWSSSLTLFTYRPDVTSCFRYTALTWIPAIYLLLTSLVFIPFYYKKAYVHGKFQTSALNFIKMLFILALLVLAFLELIRLCVDKDELSIAAIQATAFNIIMMCIVGFYTRWTYRKGAHYSGVLFLYWMLLGACDAIYTTSHIIRQKHEQVELFHAGWWYSVRYSRFALVCLTFLVHIPADTAALETSQTKSQKEDKDEERTPLLGKTKSTKKIKTDKPCPQTRASFLSILFFGWYNKFVYDGYRRTHQYTDIWDIRDADSSDIVVNKFLDNWHKELKKAGYQQRADGTFNLDILPDGKKAPSLPTAIFHTIKWTALSGGALLLVQCCSELINPQILSALINFVQTGDPYEWHGYTIAVGMFVISAMNALMFHHAFNMNYTMGMRVRTAITGAIYRKAMHLTATSRKNTSTGEITNLMSVDAQKMQDVFSFIHYVWISPIIIILGTTALWQRLGVASIAAIVWYIFLIPIMSMVTGKIAKGFQSRQMKLKDSRIKLMNQILSGIKVLKLYAWEAWFAKRVNNIRDDELHTLRKGGFILSMNFAISFSSQFLAALFTFVIYTFTVGDGTLPADVAFVSLSLLGALALPIMILPGSVMGIVSGLVSMKRLTKFLLEQEIDPDDVTHSGSIDNAITIEDGTFTWGDPGTPTLAKINVSIPAGHLVAVVGQVGSGKSSFISALLGEMSKIQGHVNVDGYTAYVPQQAWIQNMTLRDNILFTKAYVRDKYQEILTNCQLQDDLKILIGGDMIEIGERGINLSGGQKQRVALARACYQNLDVYLLDDPLSAVDSHVGKYIFDKVVGPHGMLRNKTRVICTNSVSFLSQVDMIICLEDGRVTESGAYDELLSHAGPFSNYIATYLQQTEHEEDDEDEAVVEVRKELVRRLSSIPGTQLELSGDATGVRRPSLVKRKSMTGTPLRRLSRTNSQQDSRRVSRVNSMLEGSQTEALIMEESVEEGNIQLNVIRTYINAATFKYLGVCILGMFCTITGQVGSSLWLAAWSTDVLLPPEEAAQKVSLRIGLYTFFGFTSTSGLILITVGVLLGTIKASRTMHTVLLDNILKAPMTFFDTTPLGRIINRFSKDIDTLDDQLRMQIQFWMMQVSPLIVTIVVITYNLPIFIVVVIPLVLLFALIQRVYITTARQVKRIDSIKRSPVYANFTETLNGISSIRAYAQEERFTHNADTLLDDNQKVWFAVFSSNRWIGVLAQIAGNTVVFFTAIFCVYSRETLDAGSVGLVLTYALMVGMMIVTVLRTTCELETYIVAVERIREYAEVPTEAPWHNPANTPAVTWPERGVVEFSDYCLRYRPGLDLVLKGVTCTVQPGEKVGIVGRTGAGKSSLTVALFRIVEGAGGTITIDGHDIGLLGLHDIRDKLTIIPQDPVVFSGTMRFNIDPSGEYPDKDIWSALEHSHLKEFVASQGQGLEFECGEDGQNMSVGQRQLLCLARALLRRTRILILDEATAAVDLETDDLIQNTIRREFKESTILTIAHRLNTIMDYDKVMVMSAGKVVEFDSPSNLLANEEGMFHGMAKDAGLV